MKAILGFGFKLYPISAPLLAKSLSPFESVPFLKKNNNLWLLPRTIKDLSLHCCRDEKQIGLHGPFDSFDFMNKKVVLDLFPNGLADPFLMVDDEIVYKEAARVTHQLEHKCKTGYYLIVLK